MKSTLRRLFGDEPNLYEAKLLKRIKDLEEAVSASVKKKDLRIFITNPSVVENLPLTFDNGAVFVDLKGYCNCCDRPLLPQNFRGYFDDTSTSEKKFVGVGICESCVSLTRFSAIFHDDLSVTNA